MEIYVQKNVQMEINCSWTSDNW